MTRILVDVSDNISPEHMEQCIEIIGRENIQFQKHIVNIYAKEIEEMGEDIIVRNIYRNVNKFKKQKRQNFRSPKFNF